MAVRLAVDLGLHLDVHDYTESGIISPEEEKLRSTVFWGAFVHDRYEILQNFQLHLHQGWRC
jgi:hypothetical protein